MSDVYDFVVGGGSIAGLGFAAEAASRGSRVLVLEEHPEIGEPEKCDGLVSLRGLRKLGYAPEPDVIQNRVFSGVVHSPDDTRLAVNATTLDVVVLDRSAFDKQLSRVAEKRGAEVRTGTRVSAVAQSEESVIVSVDGGTFKAKYYVDATGPSANLKHGILPAAKYEVEADWVRGHAVEVFLSSTSYPGFFSWVIPFGEGKAKVGAAGFGTNPFRALDGFLDDRPCKVLRRVAAPIYIGGPVAEFVKGRTIFVGESAGQVKPTTAGGITTSMAGAVSAAHWGSESLRHDDPTLLGNYQREWETRFLKEMRAMLRIRGVFEKLSNEDLDAVVGALSTPKLILALSQSDFDFHATALLGALGLGGLLKVARVVGSAEVRSMLVAR